MIKISQLAVGVTRYRIDSCRHCRFGGYYSEMEITEFKEISYEELWNLKDGKGVKLTRVVSDLRTVHRLPSVLTAEIAAISEMPIDMAGMARKMLLIGLLLEEWSSGREQL